MSQFFHWDVFRRKAAGLAPPARASAEPTLGARIERLRAAYRDCRICARDCGVDRYEGPGGFCGLDARGRAFGAFVHHGEESAFAPTFAVFFAGCTLRCRFCSEWQRVVQPGANAPSEPAGLAVRADEAWERGARTIEFVGGSPDASALASFEVIARLRSPLPVVWNSEMMQAPELLELLDGVVDLYVADLKFGNDACASRLAGTGALPGGYLGTAWRNLERTAGHAAVLVRHLVVPGHEECCTRPVLAELARRLPGAQVNVMTHFQPPPGRCAAADPLWVAAGSGAVETRVVLTTDGRAVIERLAEELLPVARSLESRRTGDTSYRRDPP